MKVKKISKNSMKCIVINPNLIAKVLISIASVLIILSVITQITAHLTGHPSMYGLIPFFNVDDELNLPTFFSGLMLLFTTFLLSIIIILKRNDKNRFYWTILAAGFFYMTFDEIFMLHERFINPMTQYFLGDHLSGIFHFSWLMWVIPFGVLALVLFFIFIKFLREIQPRIRAFFFVAGFIYVGGAIGIELIEGFVSATDSENKLLNNLVSTIQEGLEMYSVIIFILSLLYYISEDCNELCFKLNE